MSVAEHRRKVLDKMEEESIAIVYAGTPIHTNEDDYYYPFEVNSQFYYLTGLERAGMILLMIKTKSSTQEIIFIEEADPTIERWTGKMPTKDDVKNVSGIDDVRYIPSFAGTIDRLMTRSIVKNAYMDTFRNSLDDLADYNAVKALEFRDKYPGVNIIDLHMFICPIRRVKDAEEVGYVKEAISITGKGLEEVLKTLKPGMIEYQVQAAFEYRCKCLGAKKWAFPTIAGSGINGCMMHYETNDAPVKDDGLILLDLGAKYKNYCSDITRTYPVSGKFSERQKEYYELVLSANKAVAKAAKPGISVSDLQDLTKKILGEGLVKMGKIEKVEDVTRYYMHGVSHSIGIDAHDVDLGNAKLEAGWIISDEPGLYIDEEEIGIRIEDDLLITETGCEVLSKDIIKEVEEIESFMANHRQ